MCSVRSKVSLEIEISHEIGPCGISCEGTFETVSELDFGLMSDFDEDAAGSFTVEAPGATGELDVRNIDCIRLHRRMPGVDERFLGRQKAQMKHRRIDACD